MVVYDSYLKIKKKSLMMICRTFLAMIRYDLAICC